MRLDGAERTLPAMFVAVGNGRSYGGGMLKHEPKEADLLPVLSPDALEAVAKSGAGRDRLER